MEKKNKTKDRKISNGNENGIIDNGNLEKGNGILARKDWEQELLQNDDHTEQELKYKARQISVKEQLFLEKYRDADTRTRLEMMEEEGNNINGERSQLEMDFQQFYRNEWLKEKLRAGGSELGLEQILSQISQSTNPTDLYHYADYLLHHGDEKEKLESLYYYIFAADHGEKNAQIYLGKLYFKADHVRQDYRIAIRYFKLAAKQSDDFSQNLVGICYRGGLGVTKNGTKAVKYWERAAEQGNFNAHLNLMRFATENREWYPWVKPMLVVTAAVAVALLLKQYKKIFV